MSVPSSSDVKTFRTRQPPSRNFVWRHVVDDAVRQELDQQGYEPAIHHDLTLLGIEPGTNIAVWSGNLVSAQSPTAESPVATSKSRQPDVSDTVQETNTQNVRHEDNSEPGEHINTRNIDQAEAAEQEQQIHAERNDHIATPVPQAITEMQALQEATIALGGEVGFFDGNDFHEYTLDTLRGMYPFLRSARMEFAAAFGVEDPTLGPNDAADEGGE
ncbi:Hypothetical predicted protein [Lecanosticta acicola]|uniref:Uncharacterized protein n=1 Tax=Lecanosticta acicola TaxID=111012 RepID=A0AAI8YXU2_9PEZI|nr:Hypothetical predicted protein [Lecanosticta acicola]